MYKISVIVPIHNSEKTMDRCIDSIVSQTYQEMEIILVENASGDGSYQKCLEWAEKDSRIRVLHLSEARISKARNAGLDVMTGDYFAFVDSDDYIDHTMYQRMAESAEENNSDMVCCRIHNVFPDGKICVCEEKNLEKLYCDKKIQYWFEEKEEYVRRAIWRSLYKTSQLGKIRFNEEMSFKEDICFLNECILLADRISVVKEPLYFYSQNYGIANYYVRKYYSSNFCNTLKLVIESSEKLLASFSEEKLSNVFQFDTLCLAVSGIVMNEKDYRSAIKRLYEDEFWKKINSEKNYRAYMSWKHGKSMKIKGFLVRHNMYLALKIARLIR